MIAQFDIFKVIDGALRWVEASATLDAAKARVQELMRSSPVEFLIFSQRTGHRISVKRTGRPTVMNFSESPDMPHSSDESSGANSGG